MKMTDEKKEELRKRVGRRIALLREREGLSQTELAERAGLQRPHVVRIEQGRYDLTLSVMESIAAVFGMTVDFIDPRLAGLDRLRELAP